MFVFLFFCFFQIHLSGVAHGDLWQFQGLSRSSWPVGACTSSSVWSHPDDHSGDGDNLKQAGHFPRSLTESRITLASQEYIAGVRVFRRLSKQSRGSVAVLWLHRGVHRLPYFAVWPLFWSKSSCLMLHCWCDLLFAFCLHKLEGYQDDDKY